MEYQWIFWGYIPTTPRDVDGTMSFGDVTLYPETGVFQAEAMTSGRLKCLIFELKRICTGIPILEAAMEMQPVPKVKRDPKAMEENRKLLQEGLNVDVKLNIDKQAMEGISIHCGYCGATEKNGVNLLRCACKATYYCNKKHQKEHWKDHKKECIRIREGSS